MNSWLAVTTKKMFVRLSALLWNHALACLSRHLLYRKQKESALALVLLFGGYWGNQRVERKADCVDFSCWSYHLLLNLIKNGIPFDLCPKNQDAMFCQLLALSNRIHSMSSLFTRCSLQTKLHVGGKDHPQAPVPSLRSHLPPALWLGDSAAGGGPPQHIVQTLHLFRSGTVKPCKGRPWAIYPPC